MRLRRVVRGRRREGGRCSKRIASAPARPPAAPGLVREDFDASFQATASAHGLRAARVAVAGDAARVAGFRRRAAALRDPVRSRAAGSPAASRRATPTPSRRLRREYDARREAGFDHSWLTAAALARETALDGGGAIRTRGFALDPYRACLGLPRRPRRARRALLFERTAVTPHPRQPQARRDHDRRGALHRRAVVIATGAPLPDLRALRRHLAPQQQLRGRHRKRCPRPSAASSARATAAVRDAASPPHVLRWLKDDRVLFSGADQGPVAARARDKMLVQRSDQLMYELSTHLSGDLRRDAGVGAGTSPTTAPSDGLPVRRPAPQFSAASVRARPRPPRRRRGLAGRARAPAAVPGGARQRATSCSASAGSSSESCA